MLLLLQLTSCVLSHPFHSPKSWSTPGLTRPSLTTDHPAQSPGNSSTLDPSSSHLTSSVLHHPAQSPGNSSTADLSSSLLTSSVLHHPSQSPRNTSTSDLSSSLLTSSVLHHPAQSQENSSTPHLSSSVMISGVLPHLAQSPGNSSTPGIPISQMISGVLPNKVTVQLHGNSSTPGIPSSLMISGVLPSKKTVQLQGNSSTPGLALSLLMIKPVLFNKSQDHLPWQVSSVLTDSAPDSARDAEPTLPNYAQNNVSSTEALGLPRVKEDSSIKTSSLVLSGPQKFPSYSHLQESVWLRLLT